MKYFDIPEATNSINVLLTHIATKRELFYGGVKVRPTRSRHLSDQFQGLDLERAADVFITAFRKGELGLLTLDDCSSDALEAYFESDVAVETNVASKST
jgi:hypothetical protein